jgi:energy-coupling factor transporter ATP-binding protein EcfA2
MTTSLVSRELIRFENVSFSYETGGSLIDGMLLSIKAGERVCLVGRNGSGKSTFLKLLAGLLMPVSGQVIIDGISTANTKRLKEMRRKVGFIFQNPEDQIIATTVEADVAYTLENLGVDREAMHARVAEYCRRFGLADLLKRHPLTLSAGEKQRTALASVLIVEPEVLLLDEPTSFLDYRGRRHFLESVFADTSRTVIGATQFPAEIENYDRVIFLEEGGAVFDGARDEFQRTDWWKEMVSAAIDSGANGARNEPPAGDRTALALRGVSFGYSKQSRVIEAADARFQEGAVAAVMGDSGCGKTTLALLLAGLVEPNGGAIMLNGADVSARELMKQVGVLFQFPEFGFFAETVLEEVAFGIKNLRLPADAVEAKVRAVLAQVELGYDSFAMRNPFLLSAGEQRRVASASMLIMERPILVFDETTLGLDWEGRAAMVRLIQNLKASGRTIVLMTHDWNFVVQTADELVLMDQGKVVWQGTPEAADRPSQFMQGHFGV